MEIRLSAKLFAEFVTGGPAKKSSTVRKILRPRSPEAHIPSGYYKRAIGIIRAYHDDDNDVRLLRREMRALFEESQTASTAQTRTKWLNNLRAVETYMKSFADRKWKVKSCQKIHYIHSDVRISGNPDLAIEDSTRTRLIKLGIRKKKETEEMVRVMLRIIFQAGAEKLSIQPNDVTYFDTATGHIISGDPSDSNLAKTIDGGCVVLQQMVHSKVTD